MNLDQQVLTKEYVVGDESNPRIFAKVVMVIDG